MHLPTKIKHTRMKKYIIATTTLFASMLAYSQSLGDIYNGGTVKLIPDTEFAKANDWNTIF